jgi:hypothetical protein
MHNGGMIDTHPHEDLLPAIARLEYRLAEAEQGAHARRMALSEPRAVQCPKLAASDVVVR